jgi:hypothetical protein
MAAIEENATNGAYKEDNDDDDDDKIVHELLYDTVTKQSFAAMIKSAATGSDIHKVTNLLSNTSQRYGHSITRNALIKIIIYHLIFR